VLNDAVSAYEAGGEHQLRQYLQEIEATQHVRAYLFDERGEELRTALLLIGLFASPRAVRAPLGMDFILPAPPMQRDSRASSDGKHRYTLVMGLPPGPRVFIGPRGMPLPALFGLVLLPESPVFFCPGI